MFDAELLNIKFDVNLPNSNILPIREEIWWVF